MEEQAAEWLQVLLKDFGPFAILVWYLWFRTAISDPRREAAFCTTIENVVAKFDVALKEERDSRRSDLVALREALRCDEK